jgi:hypothetical protein
MIVFGGRDGANAALNDISTFTISTRRWNTTVNPTGSRPSARYGHFAVVSNGFMIIFGGTTTGSDYLNDIYRYNIAANSWSATPAGGTAPAGRRDHYGMALPSPSTVAYFFGGFSGTARNDVIKYDANAHGWVNPNAAGTPPSIRYDHSVSFLSIASAPTAFIFGGTDGTTANADIKKYAVGSDNWSNTPSLGTAPSARSGHTSIGTNAGIVYIFGGVSGAGTYLNEIVKYNAIDCSAAPACNDDNLCTVDACVVGSCDYTNRASGFDCNDNLFCNGPSDTCDANGQCIHTGDPCAAEPLCNNQCNEASDNCLAPTGTPCNDNLFCTAVDICEGGICRGQPGDPCRGNPVCNATCNEATDSCASTSGVTCDDGFGCTLVDSCNGLGACVGSQSPCSATDVCRQCQDFNGTAVCLSPTGTTCPDDGVYCNGAEQCNNGFCEHVGNPCSTCPTLCIEAERRCDCVVPSSGSGAGESGATRSSGAVGFFLVVAALLSSLL